MFAKYPQFGRLTRSAAFATLSDPVYCGKMKILVKLLDIFKKEGSKVLLFSYYTKLLDILEHYIQGSGIEYRRIDGNTQGHLRVKYVQEFNKDKFIFLCLISTKAGGLGLNMTGANVVVIFDPNWNPAYDQQAQDRAYRIGQQRDVRVYRLVSTGTIEENMYLRQIYKQQVASTTIHSESARRYFVAVAGDKRHHGEIFGLANIFRFGTEGCLTKDLIEREQTVEQGIKMAKYISGVVTQQTIDKQTTADEGDESEVSGDNKSDSDEEWIVSQISGDVMDVDDSDSENNDSTTSGSHNLQLTWSTDEDDGSEGRHSSIYTRTKTMALERRMPNLKGSKKFKGTCNEEQIEDFDSDSEITCGQKHPQIKINPEEGRNRKISKSEKNEVKPSRGTRSGGKLKPTDKSVKGKGKVCKISSRKISVDEDNISDDDVGDNVMKNRKKMKVKNDDTIDDVLKGCGVNYIHSNAKIIGGSKAEKHMSKCAMRDVFEEKQFSQQPANCHVPVYESSEESDDLGVSHKTQSLIKESSTAESEDVNDKDVFDDVHINPVILHNKHDNFQVGNMNVILGGTPKAIRQQQFSDMVKVLELTSQLQLAKTILAADSEERCEMLTRYYSKKHDNLPRIAEYYHLNQKEEKDRQKQTKAAPKTKPTKRRGRKKQLPAIRRQRAKSSVPVVYESDDDDNDDNDDNDDDDNDDDDNEDDDNEDDDIVDENDDSSGGENNDDVTDEIGHDVSDVDFDEDVSLRTGASRKRRIGAGMTQMVTRTGSKYLNDNDAGCHGDSEQEENSKSMISNHHGNNDLVCQDDKPSPKTDKTDKYCTDDVPSLRKEANFSFLDDIFLNNESRDSDPANSEGHDELDDNLEPSTSLWVRNTNYESRDVKQTQKDSQDDDVFTKYASSFVPKEDYRRNKEKT